MKKIEYPKFFVMYKEFNNGKIVHYDILQHIWDNILLKSGKLSKKEFYIYDDKYNKINITTKDQLSEYLNCDFRYHYWAKCEWEFICIDWPNRQTIEESRPVKIDVYDQIEPNLPVITDLVWNVIKDKIDNL